MRDVKERPLSGGVPGRPELDAPVEAASVHAFRVGLGVGGGLMMLGGVISLVGIVNPKRRREPSGARRHGASELVHPCPERAPRGRGGARRASLRQCSVRASRRSRRAQYQRVAEVALGALDADRLHRRRGAADRLRARLPGLAEVLRRRGAAARDARVDRVRQPAALRASSGSPRSPRARSRGAGGRSAATSRVLGVLLPLGVVGQAVLGGFTVRNHLAPGFVMGHYALSMLILVAAVGARLARALRAGRAAARRSTALGVWAVRALLPLGALTIFFGTAATAAGPHAGGAGTGDEIDRLEWKGLSTLDWAIHQHGRIATVLGVAVVAVYVLLWRRGAPGDVAAAGRGHRGAARGAGRGRRDPVRARGARRDRLGARRARRADVGRAAVVGRRRGPAGARLNAASSCLRRSG